MSDIKIFKDMPDDGAYIDWLKNNKNGFVLNIDKGGTQSIYPMLHKASGGCNSFPTERKDKNWTTNDADYFKVCSNSRKKLSEWSWSVFIRKRTQKGRLRTDIARFAKSFSDNLKSTDCSTLFILLFGKHGCGDTRNIFCFQVRFLILYREKFQAAFDFPDRFLD